MAKWDLISTRHGHEAQQLMRDVRNQFYAEPSMLRYCKVGMRQRFI